MAGRIEFKPQDTIGELREQPRFQPGPEALLDRNVDGRYSDHDEDRSTSLGVAAITRRPSRGGAARACADAGVAALPRSRVQNVTVQTGPIRNALGLVSVIEEFEKETDRLWQQVKPLYDDLHCYVRGKLQQKYGKDKVPDHAPIPAHLLGNMWAQTWDNLYPILKPENSDIGYDLTKILQNRHTDYKQMVNYALEKILLSLLY